MSAPSGPESPDNDSLTRQLFVRPQAPDARPEPYAGDESTRMLSMEELRQIGRENQAQVPGVPQGPPPAMQPVMPPPPPLPPQGPPPPQQLPPQPIQQPPRPQAPQKSKVPGIAIALIVLGVLALVSVGGYIVYDTFFASSGPDITGPDVTATQGEPTQQPGNEPTQQPGNAELTAFMSPSTNIVCTIDTDRARCTIRDFDYNAGDAPANCEVNPYGSVVVVEADEAGFSCVQRGLPTQATVLDYGQSIDAHGFSCVSERDGVTCRSSSGASFKVARAAAEFN